MAGGLSCYTGVLTRSHRALAIFTLLGGQGSTTGPPIRKERKQVLQLLFIDIQVGSIATGLEAAAVVREMEGGGWSACLQQQSSGVKEQKCTVHKVGVKEAEGAGESSKGQGQSLLKLEPLPYSLRPLLLADYLLIPRQGWEFSGYPFSTGTESSTQRKRSRSCCPLCEALGPPVLPAPLLRPLIGWGHMTGGPALNYPTQAGS